MISILIPVYNFDCTDLINELRASCVLARVEYEIIIGNDCSTDPSVLKSLEAISKLDRCRVINEPKNIGRAFILNKLAQLSAYPFLIIIDSDARVAKDDFIEKYIQVAVDHDVVCGGIEVRKEDALNNNKLRYKYEQAATKSRALEYRKNHPYEKFSTFNLLIRRSVFESIKFDSRCYQYGYEDTILGIDLMRLNIEVLHINNPLIHTGIDSNKSFLSKTHQALQVLKGLDVFYQEHLRLSRVALRLKRYHLLPLMKLWHEIFGKLEYKSLLTCPSVNMFYLYKLGYFSCLLSKKRK